MAASKESRIKKIQEMLKVPQTGTFDFETCNAYETLNKLNIATTVLSDLKKEIQKSLGFTDNGVDGKVGPNTLSQIEKVLKINIPPLPGSVSAAKLKIQDTGRIQNLKDTIRSLNYKWFDDQPNIIGIRTKLQVPDIFNDILFIVYNKNGIEQLYSALITTEPGVKYQKKLLNTKGCWVMMPAQMIDAYKSGFHQQKRLGQAHRCLQSVGRIYGLREDDQDGVLFNDQDAVASWQEGTSVGANIHGAGKQGNTQKVGSWSAGCQVHNNWAKKEEMMNIVDSYRNINNSLVTYTLINEADLVE